MSADAGRGRADGTANSAAVRDGAFPAASRNRAGPPGLPFVERFLIHAQLRPWWASFQVAAVSALLCVAVLFVSPEPIQYLSVAALLLIAASFMCHTTRRARALTDRLAPVIAFVAAGWGVGLVAEGISGINPHRSLGERTSGAAVGAMLIAWAVPFRHVMRTGGVPSDLVLAGIATTGVLLDAYHDLDKWGTLAVTSIAFECAVLCSLRLSLVLGFAGTLGLVHAVFLIYEFAWNRGSGTALGADYLAAALVLWPAGALLARVARRGRSMSVIPLDHPVHADFGARVPRGLLDLARGSKPALWAHRWVPVIVVVAITVAAFGFLVRLLLSDVP